MTHGSHLLCFEMESPSTSRGMALVSGIIRNTNNNCSTIMPAKHANTVAGPMLLNKTGTIEGIAAASTQWVELPNACPEARSWVGNISEMNTQMTVP